MRYELGPLRHPLGRLHLEFSAPLPAGTGAEAAGLVECILDLTNAGGCISVRGQLRVPLQTQCARCLCALEQVLELAVNEECALRQLDAPQSYESPEDSLQIPILNDDELDLSELVRQLVAMNIPARTLCREDCRGLCPTCGADLNEGRCGCEGPEIDPRWAGLGKLKL
jgi:uncharacterized protein